MANIQEVFERRETKYVLSRTQYHALIKALGKNIEPDIYFRNTNCSVYFDTPEYELVSLSLEKPIYKQKIRVRSYGVPKSDESPVFLEIKKKFDDIGNKRRVTMRLKDFYHFLQTDELNGDNPQIEREIKHVFHHYDLRPTMYIAYERYSYCSAEDPNFRLTFDFDVRSRLDHLRLEDGDQGELYFKNGEIIMEAKSLGAFPMWFVRELSRLHIYPASFQKYGYIYQARFNEIINNNKKENK